MACGRKCKSLRISCNNARHTVSQNVDLSELEYSLISTNKEVGNKESDNVNGLGWYRGVSSADIKRDGV